MSMLTLIHVKVLIRDMNTNLEIVYQCSYNELSIFVGVKLIQESNIPTELYSI